MTHDTTTCLWHRGVLRHQAECPTSGSCGTLAFLAFWRLRKLLDVTLSVNVTSIKGLVQH